jgi:hypothetical protein
MPNLGFRVNISIVKYLTPKFWSYRLAWNSPAVGEKGWAVNLNFFWSVSGNCLVPQSGNDVLQVRRDITGRFFASKEWLFKRDRKQTKILNKTRELNVF